MKFKVVLYIFLEITVGLISYSSGQGTPNDDVLTLIDDDVLTLIDSNVDIVNRLADAAAADYADRCSGSVNGVPCSQAACQNRLEGGRATTQFGKPVITTFRGQCTHECSTRRLDFDKSAIRLPSNNPTGVTGQDETTDNHWTRNLDEDFRSQLGNSIETITLRWQYIGTPSGLFRGYPGDAQETCASYDPRIRPWYVAATSGPKNVVLVIDVSGSMGDFGRLELAKDAAKTVIDTLTNFDYVGVVIFSDAASTLYTTTMVPASSANLLNLNSAIDGITARGTTNYEAAFREAFDLLTRSRIQELATSCQTAILFLTDGMPTEGETDTNNLQNLVSSLNTESAVIFTFTLGSNAPAAIPKVIACGNKGIYIHVNDNENLRDAMSNYYNYFATVRQVSDNLKPVWVEPYIDAFGLGEVATVSRALYDTNVDPPRLYGVVSVDILTTDLRNADETNWQNTILYLSRQVTCPTIKNVSECFLDAIRRSSGSEESVCESNSVTQCSIISSWTCPNHGSVPNICNTRRDSFQSEICFDKSNLIFQNSTVDSSCCSDKFDPADVNANPPTKCDVQNSTVDSSCYSDEFDPADVNANLPTKCGALGISSSLSLLIAIIAFATVYVQ